MTAFPVALLTYTLRQINHLPHTNDEDIGGDNSRSRIGSNSVVAVETLLRGSVGK
jgi:hypothetical protein